MATRDHHVLADGIPLEARDLRAHQRVGLLEGLASNHVDVEHQELTQLGGLQTVPDTVGQPLIPSRDLDTRSERRQRGEGGGTVLAKGDGPDELESLAAISGLDHHATRDERVWAGPDSTL